MTNQWRVAGSLLTLLAEVNHRWPGRDKASDGTIGDASHAAHTSDHNPWVKDANGIGVVRALDVDSGPGLNPDEDHDQIGDKVTNAVIAAAKAGHPAMGEGSYVIHEHRIASAKSYPPWSWRRYDGVDPHTSHPHISVSLHQHGYDSTKRWGVWPAHEAPKPPVADPVTTNKPPTLWMRMSKRRAKKYEAWTKRAQRRLGLTPDGIFGPVTRRHVVAYRRAHHIHPYRSGVIGSRVWKPLLKERL